ncbi:RNA-binding protein [Amycolatopsis sp. H6(2020)]|nr:RNA-binding protein [Amycolatopsis sp. H6(2020)]
MLNEDDWAALKRRYPVGAEVPVTVDKHASFGMFVLLPDAPGVSAVIDAISYRPDGIDVYDHSQWPAEGSRLTATVGGYRERHQQFSLRVGPPIAKNR